MPVQIEQRKEVIFQYLYFMLITTMETSEFFIVTNLLKTNSIEIKIARSFGKGNFRVWILRITEFDHNEDT